MGGLAGLLSDVAGMAVKAAPKAAKAGEVMSIPADIAAQFVKAGDPAAVRGAEIMDMLRSGRSDDVTEKMLDMGYPIMNANLNQYLYQNYDLPMDQASRMERARAMGHQTGLYSGTGEDFSAFNDSAVYATTNPDLAYTYSPSVGGSIMPLTMRAMNGSPVVNAGGARWNRLTGSMRAGGDNAPYIPHMFTTPELVEKYGENVYRTRDFEEAAKAQGFSGVTFNDVEDVGGYFNKYFPEGPLRDAQSESIKRAFIPSKVEARMYPNQVRSQFARFDPRLAHLRNLSAAAAGTGLLGTALQDRNTERGF